MGPGTDSALLGFRSLNFMSLQEPPTAIGGRGSTRLLGLLISHCLDIINIHPIVPDMTLDAIRVFCDVAQQRSFSQGAELSGITQSAASQRVRSLEEELGVQLIDRSTRPCRLTAEGRIYFRGCRDILDQYERLKLEVEGSAGPLRGRVEIVSIYSADVAHLEGVKEGFQSEHPGSQVEIHYLHPGRIHDWVRDEQCDFGILSYPDRWSRLASIPLRDEPMVAVFPRGHRFAERTWIGPRKLEGEKLAGFDEDLPISKEIRSYLRSHGVRPKMAVSFDNVDTIKAAVADTGSVAILPERTVRSEVERGVLGMAPLRPTLIRPLGVVYRRDREFPPVVQAFLDRLLQSEGVEPEKRRRAVG